MPRQGKKIQRYDYSKTKILEDLRTERVDKITIKRMVEVFGVGRETVRDWELGFSKPHSEDRYRKTFINYLKDTLLLRRDLELLKKVWNDVMFEQWHWQPYEEFEEVSGAIEQHTTIRSVDSQVWVGVPTISDELIGRQLILRRLRQRLFSVDSLALTGLPGVGKTALAVTLANDRMIRSHFLDGILWAKLGRSGNVMSQLSIWASTLNIDVGKVSEPNSAESWGEAIHKEIGLKKFLIVIDDAWSYEDAIKFKVGGSNCAHLLTTRSMSIATMFAVNEVEQVPELSKENGLRVLERLTPRVVRAEPENASKLVNLVGGLPLALKLIGNYLRKKSVSSQPQLIANAVRELEEATVRLELAEPQPPSYLHPSLPFEAPISLHASIMLSDELLEPVSQRMLRTLSLFSPKPNSFSIEAAIAISEGADESIATLEEHGLLESIGDTRYALHQTIADYGYSLLSDPNAEKRFAEFFVAYTQNHETDYSALDLEAENILSALTMAHNLQEPNTLINGINYFYKYLELRGLYQQAKVHLERAKQEAEILGDLQELVKIWHKLGNNAINVSDYSVAKFYLEKGLSRIDELESLGHWASLFLVSLGSVSIRRGEYEEALKVLLEGLKALNDVKNVSLNDELKARIYQNLGLVSKYLGRSVQADKYYQEGFAVAESSNDKESMCSLLVNRAAINAELGNYIQAKEFLIQSLSLATEIGHTAALCVINQNLGGIAVEIGDYSLARKYLTDGQAIAQKIGSVDKECEIATILGVVELRSGNYDIAKKLLEDSLKIARKIEQPGTILFLLENLGSLYIEGWKDYQQAEYYFQEGLALAKKIGQRERQAGILISYGRILGHTQGDFATATIYIEEGLSIAKQLGHKVHMCSAYKMIGEVALEQGEHERARETFHLSLEIAETEDWPELIGDNCFGIAQTYALQEQWEQAREFALRALETFRLLGHHRKKEVAEWLAELQH